MARVYIGIGSNIGDREANVRRAVSLLNDRDINLVRLSSLVETEPWGIRNQPAFINAVAEMETSLEPMDLLNTLREIEKLLGRFFEATRWGPRVIDLDILFYGSITINEPELKIPHPLIAERAFVLDPLFEIASDLTHPVTRKTVSQMRDELKKS
jgi:2-amino-4-hydroxy-6-hydroxymethyldihydropteridine diphosphokinase